MPPHEMRPMPTSPTAKVPVMNIQMAARQRLPRRGDPRMIGASGESPPPSPPGSRVEGVVSSSRARIEGRVCHNTPQAAKLPRCFSRRPLESWGAARPIAAVGACPQGTGAQMALERYVYSCGAWKPPRREEGDTDLSVCHIYLPRPRSAGRCCTLQSAFARRRVAFLSKLLW